MSIKKKFAFILAIVLLLGLFYGLGKQIFSSLQGGKRLDQEAEKLTSLQQKNLELKKRLEETSSLRFIEAGARDKLNLARENETIAIIPQEVIDQVLSLEKKGEEAKIPNWQGWLKLFWP